MIRQIICWKTIWLGGTGPYSAPTVSVPDPDHQRYDKTITLGEFWLDLQWRQITNLVGGGSNKIWSASSFDPVVRPRGRMEVLMPWSLAAWARVRGLLSSPSVALGSALPSLAAAAADGVGAISSCRAGRMMARRRWGGKENGGAPSRWSRGFLDGSARFKGGSLDFRWFR